MSKQAFDNLLSRLIGDEREKIYAMAAAYGLTFDDPSWVPFAITLTTLDELRKQVDKAAIAMEDAADNSVRRMNNEFVTLVKQAHLTIDECARLLTERKCLTDASEKESVARHQAALTDLSATQIRVLIEKGADGITESVTQRLTGENGMLVKSAANHAIELKKSRQHFEEAVKRAVDSTRRGIFRTLWWSVGMIGLTALLASLSVYWSVDREKTADADIIRAYVAQRDDLEKQIAGAKQLLAEQRTGHLSLRYYGNALYLLAPKGLGSPGTCGDRGPLGFFQPGGTPCVLIAH